MNHISRNVCIESSIFYLRHFDLNFVGDEYLGWLKDEEVNRYLLKADQDITIEEARRYCTELVESDHDIFLAIILKENERYIGNVRIGPIDFESRVCKFSMMIGDKDVYGRGLGTEIVEKCIDYCFEQLNMRKFCLDVIEENKAAVRIYEKNGLITEGVLQEHVLLNGKACDLRIMACFREHN